MKMMMENVKPVGCIEEFEKVVNLYLTVFTV